MRQNRLEIARMVSNPEEFNIAVAKPKESLGRAGAFAVQPRKSWRTCSISGKPLPSAAIRPRR